MPPARRRALTGARHASSLDANRDEVPRIRDYADGSRRGASRAERAYGVEGMFLMPTKLPENSLCDRAARRGSTTGAEAGATPPTYRHGVGILLLDFACRRVFVARRRGDSDGSWQMPQGGIEPGEAPEAAALRELAEEIGTDRAEILGQSRGWLRYDLPEAYLSGARHPGFRGQVQKWVAMRFVGQDTDIRLETEEPEFSAWKWVAPEQVVALAPAFRRPVYQAVLAEFAPLLGPAS